MYVYIYILCIPFPEPKLFHRYTPKQKSLLMSEFCSSPYLTRKKRTYLQEELGKTGREIDSWFDCQRKSIRELKAQVSWNGNL